MRAEKDLRDVIFVETKTNAEQVGIPFWKRMIIWGALLFAAFLLGLVPMWLSAHETTQQRDAAQANLRLSRLQNNLATAEINVRRGEYEPARVAVSNFFTDLRTEIDRNQSAFTEDQLESVKPIILERDELITLLARNDPATGNRLADLYINYLNVLNPPLQKLK